MGRTSGFDPGSGGSSPPPASWQRGEPIERLRELAAPFKTHHGPHVYGAFGLVKERDIAAALHKEGRQLATACDNDTRNIGVALWSHHRNDRRHRDFRGNDILLGGPSSFISAIAAPTVQIAAHLMRTIGADRQQGFAVEIFEEDPIAREAVERIGLGKLGTKIMAGSEIKGIYATHTWGNAQPDPADEPGLACVRPRFLSEGERAAIAGELRAYLKSNVWEDHYASYNKRKSWSAIALRGFDDDPTFIQKPAEMSKRWKIDHPEYLGRPVRWTTAAREFGWTKGLIEKKLAGYALQRVRFMRLTPGGELTRHADITDREAGTADGCVARLHIPIETNPRVTFTSWGLGGETTEAHMHSRSLWYLDTRKPHAAKNGGRAEDHGRIHLVVDVYSDDRLRRLIAARG